MGLCSESSFTFHRTTNLEKIAFLVKATAMSKMLPNTFCGKIIGQDRFDDIAIFPDAFENSSAIELAIANNDLSSYKYQMKNLKAIN